jgi:hypothetical protein
VNNNSPRGAFESRKALADDAQQAARFEGMRDTLFPEVLQITQATYRAQVARRHHRTSLLPEHSAPKVHQSIARSDISSRAMLFFMFETDASAKKSAPVPSTAGWLLPKSASAISVGGRLRREFAARHDQVRKSRL